MLDPTERLSTGIPGLDEITHGGLLPRRWYLVRGGPGAGKTTLGLHFLTAGSRGGERTLFITLEKPENTIRLDAESVGFDLRGIEFLDLSPGPEFFTEEATYDIFAPSEVERSPLTRRIIDAVGTVEPDRVFVDTLTMFRYFMPDPFQFRTEVTSFTRFLTARGATVVGSSELDPTVPDADLQFLSSGVITLHSMAMQRRGFRTLTVEKLLGSDYRSGAHAMSLGRDGMAVYPRLVPEAHVEEFQPELLSSGAPELDEMLHGGIERGTVTLIAGPSGTGKTTVGLHFMAQAAAAGEHAVIYTFEEDRATLLRRCAATGLPVSELLERGTLSIVPVEALQITADEFASRVRHEVEQEGTRFVMIDSLAGYQLTLLGPELVDQIYALCKYFRNMGVTAILTREVERIMGEFRLTEVGISYMADNILYLRFMELEGELRKAIGVLKKRISTFDPTVHELELVRGGLRVGPPLTGLRGILLGTPQPVSPQPLEQEDRARAEKAEPLAESDRWGAMSAILSVGCNRRNQELLAGFLRRHGFDVHPVCTLEEIDRALDRAGAYHAALVDVSGYDRRIWQRCERLGAAHVPFVVIAPRREQIAAREAAARGAGYVLAKPLPKEALLALIRYLGR